MVVPAVARLKELSLACGRHLLCVFWWEWGAFFSCVCSEFLPTGMSWGKVDGDGELLQPFHMTFPAKS
jgi:hypothetical protein